MERQISVRAVYAKLIMFSALTLLFAVSSRADTISLTATLSGGAETPPNNSPGTGTANVTYNNVAHTLFVSVVFSGLTSPTTASHIHCCAAPGVSGPVATTVPTFAGFPLGITSGTFSNTLDLTQPSSFNPAFVTSSGGTVALAEAALGQGFSSGATYLN